MKRLFPFLFILICVLLAANSCSKDNIVNPKEILKDPAAMHWTIDTIFYPYYESFQTLMNSIYVIDTNDIWLCGHCDDIRGTVWRYTGNKWFVYDIFNDIPFASDTPYRIFGKNDNLWMIGEKDVDGLVLRKTNNKWYDYNIKIGNRLLDGTITNSGQFFACGSDGIVISHDELGFVSDKIKIKKNPAGYYYSLPSIAEYNSTKYLIASYWPTSSPNLEWSYYFLKGSFKQWTIIDSFKINQNSTGNNPYKFGTERLYSSPWGKLYSCGYMGVWAWNNKSWENQISTPSHINNIRGARDDYIFAVGDFGYIYFYNGTGWKEMTNIVPGQKDFALIDVWTNGKVVYIVAHAGYKTLIIKGK